MLNLGGGVVFKIPLWYDDLAKTGVVPRSVQGLEFGLRLVQGNRGVAM
jgi:hypothetical protein